MACIRASPLLLIASEVWSGALLMASAWALMQGGFAEVVPMSPGQSDKVIKTGGGEKVLSLLVVGDGAADKGLQRMEPHGWFGRWCPRILAGKG